MERKLIFDSALKLINEGKFLGSPMSEIAYHASLTEKTVSYFFQNRDELVADLASHIADGIRLAIQRAQNRELSFQDNFHHVWFCLYHYYGKHPAVLAFVEQSHNFSGFREERLNEKTFISPLIHFFDSGPEMLKERFHAQALASIFHGSVVAAVKLKANKQSIFGEEEIKSLPEILWNGLAQRQSVSKT
jgi:TetR/AcrR family transcriptional regulator, multidrug resistance operon repressor